MPEPIKPGDRVTTGGIYVGTVIEVEARVKWDDPAIFTSTPVSRLVRVECICAEDSCDEWDPDDYPEGCRFCAALDPEMPCPKEPT